MISAMLGRPVPAQVLAAIHVRSDGIPLHVEEFLAAIDEDALTASRAVGGGGGAGHAGRRRAHPRRAG